MDYKIVLPVLLSFALSVIVGPVVIPILRKLKMKQTEREDGVKSHLKKAGTPTMGGVIILASIVVTSLFFIKEYTKIIPIKAEIIHRIFLKFIFSLNKKGQAIITKIGAI